MNYVGKEIDCMFGMKTIGWSTDTVLPYHMSTQVKDRVFFATQDEVFLDSALFLITEELDDALRRERS